MQDWKDELDRAYDSLTKQIDFKPQVAIVLGSGLGGFADKIESARALPYSKIEGMPQSTVEGHKGQFVFGYIGGVAVVAMQGRLHLYEGYTAQQAVMPIRLMAMMGAEYLIVTNAAGGISFREVGTLMLITDHISCMVASPLIGRNYNDVGVRFPDMTHAYSTQLASIAMQVAKQEKIDLKQGVYMQFYGPQFETPAEIKMARTMGADAVGMSTTIEVIAASHAGMQVLGISCITNPAAGLSQGTLSHVDVQHAADIAGEKLGRLICETIKRIPGQA
ncbi:MAG: purine-nucleoside phosphorylase [Christensenellales bacterium]